MMISLTESSPIPESTTPLALRAPCGPLAGYKLERTKEWVDDMAVDTKQADESTCPTNSCSPPTPEPLESFYYSSPLTTDDGRPPRFDWRSPQRKLDPSTYDFTRDYDWDRHLTAMEENDTFRGKLAQEISRSLHRQMRVYVQLCTIARFIDRIGNHNWTTDEKQEYISTMALGRFDILFIQRLSTSPSLSEWLPILIQTLETVAETQERRIKKAIEQWARIFKAQVDGGQKITLPSIQMWMAREGLWAP